LKDWFKEFAFRARRELASQSPDISMSENVGLERGQKRISDDLHRIRLKRAQLTARAA
jgi:hypothetical protein